MTQPCCVLLCRYEFIPQVIFLNALFGYLCFLIILKWVTGSTADLYHIMIYMFLNPMDIDCGGKCTVNLMFWGQSVIQVCTAHLHQPTMSEHSVVTILPQAVHLQLHWYCLVAASPVHAGVIVSVCSAPHPALHQLQLLFGEDFN